MKCVLVHVWEDIYYFSTGMSKISLLLLALQAMNEVKGQTRMGNSSSQSPLKLRSR